MKNQPGKHLNQLSGKLANPKVNYVKVLEDISKEHRFDVSYVDIQERSHTGTDIGGKQIGMSSVAPFTNMD